MDCLVNIYGFVELDADSDEVREEYKEMRASFIIQYAPELLGEYAIIPPLKSESKEDIQAQLALVQERMQKASEIPTVYKEIYRYYGVTKEDISKKTERYNNVVRALSQ